MHRNLRQLKITLGSGILTDALSHKKDKKTVHCHGERPHPTDAHTPCPIFPYPHPRPVHQKSPATPGWEGLRYAVRITHFLARRWSQRWLRLGRLLVLCWLLGGAVQAMFGGWLPNNRINENEGLLMKSRILDVRFRC